MKNKEYISLETIGNDLPFCIPEGYFEDFALKMYHQINPNYTFSRQISRPWMYAAAMFVGIVVVGQIYYNLTQKSSISTTDTYESYVLSQVDETALMDYYVDESVK
jgi:hypothetical protein